jgi:3',5'-cyclic AMP phosphodiesterase CpdA
MRRLAHLSDLHFGRHDPAVVASLHEALTALAPDLIVISGDFTQRARHAQFAEARRFVEGLRAKALRVLAVPGNHDVPLYDIGRRFLSPLRRFRRYVEADPYPYVADEEIAALGLNTARSATISDGRVSHEQMAELRRRFAGAPPGARRILVTHHPLVELPWGEAGKPLRAAGRAKPALRAAIDAGVHLLLAGHHHRPFSGSAAAFLAEGGSMLVVQAGTTTSTRLRAHANSFNVILTDGDRLTITVEAWNGQGFAPHHSEEYICEHGRWRTAAGPAA